MYIYITLAIFYLLCIIVEKILGKNINKTMWVIILIAPLFIIAAFRAPTVGNDTHVYLRSYNLVTQEGFLSKSQSRLEIGYIFYMRIIGLLGFSYFGFQVITILFILFSTGRFINKYSPNIAFSFYILLTTRMFFGMMNISRQYLAVAIILFSIEYLRNNKFIKFFILLLIAMSIHFTAIIFILIYPLSKFKFNYIRTVRLIFMGIIASIFFNQLIYLFVNITGKYAGYLEGGYFNFEANVAIYLNLLINILFFLVALFTRYWQPKINIQNNIKDLRISEKYNKGIIKVSEEQLWYVCCLLTLIISIVGLNATIFSRIEMYFSVFFLAFIPSAILKIRNRELRTIIVLGIILGLFSSFVAVMIYRPYWTTVFPYQWYWNWS